MSALIDEPTPNRNGVLTLRETAAVLRCSMAHISNIINRKVPGLPVLPIVRIGRRILIRRDAIEKWLLAVER